MDRTIKQVAEILGVSKQAVRQRINKLPSDCYKVGTNKTIYINEKGFNLLNNKVSRAGANLDTNLDIKVLVNQLDVKDKQIEELQKQIEMFQKLLDQEQQLNAMNQQKIALLEQHAEEPKKRRWWRKND